MRTTIKDFPMLGNVSFPTVQKHGPGMLKNVYVFGILKSYAFHESHPRCPKILLFYTIILCIMNPAIPSGIKDKRRSRKAQDYQMY